MNRNRLMDTDNRLMDARGEKGSGTGESVKGIEKYKLVVTR